MAKNASARCWIGERRGIGATRGGVSGITVSGITPHGEALPGEPPRELPGEPPPPAEPGDMPELMMLVVAVGELGAALAENPMRQSPVEPTRYIGASGGSPGLHGGASAPLAAARSMLSPTSTRIDRSSLATRI